MNQSQQEEAYGITPAYREQTLKSFLNNEGQVTVIPRQEKKKIVLLNELIKQFQQGKEYTEGEVNQVIKKMFADYATIRRYLVDYQYLGRQDDGKSYWVC